MINKIAIIGNGFINNITYHKKLLLNVDLLICADGGANNAKKMNVIPDYIIGDLDSTTHEILEFFKKYKTKIIEDNDQNKTDMELAIKLAESFEPKDIIILGAIGNRIDHTIANILCLNKIKSKINTKIIDDKNIIELAYNSLDIYGEKDDIISIIPLTDINELSYDGLKWNISNKNIEFGWFGISNRLSKRKANIKLKKGKFLIIRVRH